MDTNQDVVQGKWPELKDQVKQQWGKVTDDDLRQLSGKTEELAGLLQQRYGYGKVQAEMEINNWAAQALTMCQSHQHRRATSSSKGQLS